MRIGFDYRMGGTRNSGIGRYSFELLKNLIALSKDEFFVFYNDDTCDHSELEAIKGDRVTLVPANYRHYSLSEQIFFPKLLNKFNLDLVHFPNFNVPVLYRKPFVVTIHDMVHHQISGHKKSRYHKFLAYKYIIEHAAKHSEKIITVSQSAKEDIVTILGTDPNKILVTYEAPDRFTDTPTNFDHLKKIYLLSRPYLLFCGTLERKKNIVGLVKGFDRFLKKYKYDMDLVIVGKDDPHYPNIREQCLEIQHKNNLVFTGFVNSADQASFYRNSFAYITASLHEGFGLPALEAMQYGVPVLASNIKVYNEVYDNAALYFDPLNPEDIADKIKLLVSDQPFYEAMQKKSMERSTLFDWRDTAKQTLEIYHGVSQANFSPESE